MNLDKIIQKEGLTLSLQSKDKQGVIEELLDSLVRADRIQNRKPALKAILDREKKMSTGMHNGLAIPHGKTETVDSLHAAIGLSPQGIDFNSQDGKPSQIFILTVSPVNRAGPHIQFLAEISRLMNR